MNSRRFAGIFFAIFLIGALPLLLVQPTGSGSAGLSAGFMAPLSVPHLLVMCLLGVWGTWLGKEAILMLPLTFITMIGIAGLLALGPEELPYHRLIIFAAILLFALSIASSYNRAFIISASITSSIAFHMGTRYMANLPEIGAPLYYLVGLLICVALILATGVSLGLTLLEEFVKLKERLRNVPSIANFMSFF